MQLKKPGLYRPFIPLFFSLVGWAFLHTWFFLIGANHRAHIAVAVLGLVIAAWPAWHFANGQLSTAGQAGSPGVSRGGALSTALLLSAMGAVLGSLVANGSVFLLAAVAMALNYVPWGRLPLSRHHPALSCAMTTGGFAAALWLRHQAIDVMFLPFAAWAFWVAACIGLMQVAEQSRRSKRSMAAQSTAVKGGIHPAIFDT
ncbi:hypothetical protein [Massilia sp. LjRoot122]|uniref:hypothetical protein n=1 Tax=Massilia sp. LjRoot122 TaxID=3342257 RepID=UPI003ECEFFDB